MKHFYYFLYEMAIGGQGKKASVKGAAYESGLTSALHRGEHNDDLAKEYARHLSHLSTAVKTDIHKGIETSAPAIRAHLEKHYGIAKSDKIHAHWTAKPGHLAKVTGKVEDKTNPGDTVISHKGKHVALSLKFGAKPGLRSPGVKDLENMAKQPINPHKDKNAAELAKLGSDAIHGNSAKERNKSFREAEHNPKHKEVVSNIKSKSLEHRSEVAANLAHGLNNNNTHAEHHEIVRRLLNAEKTHTPVVKVHYDTKKHTTHLSDPVNEFEKIKPHTTKYSFEHKGMYVHVHAHDKAGNKHHIATIGIKNNSSPYTHTVGSVSKGNHYDKFVKSVD